MNFPLDFHAVSGEVILPLIDFIFAHGKSHVPWSFGAVEGSVILADRWNGRSFGMEEEHHALAAAKKDMSSLQFREQGET